MFRSLRYNIYFFLLLLAALCLLWLIHYSGNKAIGEQQHIHARIIKLNSRFSQFILKEQEVLGNAQDFNAVFNQEKQLFRQCTACHSSKTNLPDQRLSSLREKQESLLKIAVLRKETRKRLSSLFDSVHYIHEHHIVTLQNYLRYIRTELSRSQPDSLRKMYADEAAVEPDIIRQAVEIQHQLANIIYDFNMLTGGDVPDQVHVAFRRHIASFYTAVKAFEEYSLDAQDGLLVEELLASGRTLDANFVQLINLEKTSRKLSAQLKDNHNQLDESFIRLEAGLLQKQDRLMKRMVVINWGLLLLAICLALAFLARARSLVRAVDLLVDETRKITSDISYRIPEQSAPLIEFSILRSALNTMAGDLNRKMESLTEEIQNRRQMELMLLQGKKEWERTFNAVPDMIFILDPEATILRANRAMLELVGSSMKEIAGRKCYEVVHQRSSFPSYCKFYGSRDDDQDGGVPLYQQHEFYEQRFDRYFTAIMSPLYSAEGELVGYVHLMRDVTDQKKAEQEKNKYALYLDSILSSSAHTAIVATDRQLRVKYFNPEAERVFQVSARDVLGKTIAQIHKQVLGAYGLPAGPADVLPGRVGRTLRKLRSQDVHNFTLTYGSAVIEARLSVIRSADGLGESSGFLLMADDITDKVKREKQQQLMSQRLVKAEKMEAIGLMAGGVAHDLNNILSGIINYPELILLQTKGDTPWKDALEAIRDSGLRAAAIVADLLTIARGVACEKRVLSINTLVRQYLDSPEFAALATRYPEITVKTELAADLHCCRCSSVHILKILMNLVANGFEAIGDRGQVTITTVNTCVDALAAAEYKLEPGEYVELVITDNGKGITDEDGLHMFEPFYSKKKMGHSGTGLGLAVVWNTVVDHKGAITVARVEQGSAFTVLMPAVEQERSTIKSDRNDAEMLHGKGSILVVDDEPLQRDVARQMLVTLGYDVATVTNGREAVSYVQQQSVDLIILDMIMEPDMNGRQTLEQILEFRPGQKTLIASGYAEHSEVKKACTLGKTTLMNKPYTLQRLSESVQRALAT